ncbi:MAG: hypothetical protein EXR72_15215 [Myxococcales bacterium]|nr:hypothetical protein [Myxococcales bacterium]
MRRQVRKGVWTPGGIVSYPLENIFKEVAFIAYHFHWARDPLFELSHKERHTWVKEISTINEKINAPR